MRLLAVSLLSLLAVAGCEITPEQRARDVCNALCACVVPGSPSAVERCVVNDCLPDIPPVSDPCVECVYTNSQRCGDLLDECIALCF
jgi:hypothetical protein